MRKLLITAVLICLLRLSAAEQAPIIVQPANTAAPQPTAAPAPNAPDLSAALKSLQEMKAANDELLKKQEAVLQILDQLQEQADQLRIFAKRG
jgi:hypothetical protein